MDQSNRLSIGAAVQPMAGIDSSSFWRPDLIEPSAWIEHAPFAFWLVSALEPSSLVELGTHHGCSYFAFCQAVERLGLNTRCHAVDTWKGDEHAGFYDEDVFNSVRKHNEKRYLAFSSLIRSTFDEALLHFTDSSIDLLHIDGRHFYEDVKHDFESWRPKLSDRAVVLFHDTNERQRNFGVFRLWEELAGNYPSFEFLHGHGLGVLGYGSALPPRLKSFLAAIADPKAAVEVRAAYARLGSGLKAELDGRQRESALAQKAQASANEARSERQRLEAELEKTLALAQKAQATADEARSAKQRLELQVKERFAEIATLTQLLRDGEAASQQDEKALRVLEHEKAEALKLVDAQRETIARLARPARVGRAIFAVCNIRRWPAIWDRLFLQRRAALLQHSGEFDAEWYRQNYADVAAAQVDPLRHYIRYGAKEGRAPNAAVAARKK